MKHKVLPDLEPLLRPIKKIKLRGVNSNKHSERSISAIKASLREFGQRKPIVVHRATGEIEAGNGTYAAALDLGWTKIAAVYADDSDEVATAFHVVDNRTSDFREWDIDVLRDQLDQIEELDSEWFTSSELVEMVQDLSPPPVEEGDIIVDDPAEEWQDMPEFVQNDETAYRSLIVHFFDAEGVEQFAKANGFTVSSKTKFVWYPEAKIGRTRDKEYDDGPDA